MTDYDKAKKLGLVQEDRWGNGTKHHPMSLRLLKFIAENDFENYDHYFDWEVGGDGDNGETLMYQMDAFFEVMSDFFILLMVVVAIVYIAHISGGDDFPGGMA